MSQQTEEKKRTDAQTIPSNDAGRKQHPYRRWLGLAIALLAVTALLVSGIVAPVRARTTLKAETAQVALTAGSAVSPVGSSPAEDIILPVIVQPIITSP